MQRAACRIVCFLQFCEYLNHGALVASRFRALVHCARGPACAHDSTRVRIRICRMQRNVFIIRAFSLSLFFTRVRIIDIVPVRDFRSCFFFCGVSLLTRLTHTLHSRLDSVDASDSGAAAIEGRKGTRLPSRAGTVAEARPHAARRRACSRAHSSRIAWSSGSRRCWRC